MLQEDYSLTAAVAAVTAVGVAGILCAWPGSGRMTIAGLHAAVRERGIRRVSHVELRVLETDGSSRSLFSDELEASRPAETGPVGR